MSACTEGRWKGLDLGILLVLLLLGFIAWNLKQVGERLDRIIRILRRNNDPDD